MKKGKKDKQNKEQQKDDQPKMPNLICPKQFYKLPKNTTNPDIEASLKQLVKLVNGQVVIWEQDNQFQFELPQSQFDISRQTPVINYVDQQAVKDDVQPSPLSQIQTKSIYQTGTFIVNSKRYSIPYKWVLNKILYLGKNQRQETFYNILAYAFGQLHKIKQNLFGNETQRSLSFVKKTFKDLFVDFIDVIIGRPYTTSSNKLNPVQVLQIQRQLDIKTKYWDNINKSLNQLYSNDNSIQTSQQQKLDNQLSIIQINRIQNQFNFQWDNCSEIIRQKLQQQNIDQQELQQRLIEEKYKIIMKIESELKPQLLQNLHFLLQQQRIISKAFRKLKIDNQKAQFEIKKQLQSHLIKSKCKKWYFQQLTTRVNLAHQQNYHNTLQYLKTNLKTPFFQQYIQYCKTYEQKLIQSTNLVRVEKPLRGYEEITKKAISKVRKANGVFILDSFNSFKFNTGTYGWMFKYSKFVFVSILNQMINIGLFGIKRGPLSIRYLFSGQQYDFNETVNPSTGEKIFSSSVKTKPLIVELKQQVKQIQCKRKQFQQSPDTGFMKKSYARILNLIYCFVFLGLMKLILFRGIAKPLLSIICIVISTFLVVFCWYIAMSCTLVQYLWSVFIYKHKLGDYYNYSKSQFPLFQVTLKVVFNILRGIWIILLAICFHPLFSLLTFLASIVYYVFTTIYYEFIFLIIKVIGRSPTSDSKIAWRIQGPGISKNFSQKLNPDDIYILFQAQCQKIQLIRYQQIITNKLNSILATNDNLVSPIIGSFQLNPGKQNRFQQSINYYLKRLNDQINSRMRIYPILHNSVVRFTQDELNQYTGNCIEMVQFFMLSHKFADFYTYFGINNTEADKSNKLVIAIWAKIFGNRNVFEAYNSNLQRYKVIQNQRDNEQTQNIMNQINHQHKFKKGRHKKFKYQSSSTPTNTGPVIDQTFAPISNLISQLKTISTQLLSSKQMPQLSVLICPTIEKLSQKLNDIK